MNNSTTNYTYDANGNLLNDPYKGIGLQYNVLNKTDKETLTYNVTGSRYIEYIYDAGGSVLRKIAYDSSAGTTQTDYIDGFVYTNGTLAYFPSPEGRVLYNGSTYANEYTITDQQGNARVSFNNTGTGGARQVVQENSYYGFGMVLPNSPVTGGSNKNLYNGGSEWQNDFQDQPDYYQTPARNYDASLGRFVSQDPMAESAASMSTYHYAGDNPIMMNDPTGNHAAPVGRTTDLLWSQEVQDPNFQWFASNSDAEMGQWVSSLGASGGGGGAGGFAGGDLGEEEAEFDAFSAYTTAYGNAVMRDQSADYSTFWANFGGLVGNVLSNNANVNIDLSGSAVMQVFATMANMNDGDVLTLSSNVSGAIYVGTNSETASIGNSLAGHSDPILLSGATDINAIYEANFSIAVAISAGESGNTFYKKEVQGLASNLKDRTDEAHTSFYDPNWLVKICSPGTIHGNYNAIGDYDFNQVMSMTYNQIMCSTNPEIIAARDALAPCNWAIDYSNPQGFADTGHYYFGATSLILGNNPPSTYSPTNSVITLTAGSTTFYRDK